MERFNHNKPLAFDFKRSIEDYFKYKWLYDKNLALIESRDLVLFEQLPEEIQDQIYYSYIFTDFIQNYDRHFTF